MPRVSFEPSLHSSWGTGVVMGDLGLIFNCRGDYYSLVPGEANALAPGKRPRSTLQSTLVMKDGQPYMILGSPGGDDQVMRTMQTLVNILDFGMNVQQAIEALGRGLRQIERHADRQQRRGQIAVKVIDDRGNELMVVKNLTEAAG